MCSTDIIQTLKIDLIGPFANKIADEIRSGAPRELLLPMLSHSDPELNSLGCWIVSEIVQPADREVFLEPVIGLIVHDDSSVRFEATKCLFQLATPEDSKSQILLLKRLNDESNSVRQLAIDLFRRHDVSDWVCFSTETWSRFKRFVCEPIPTDELLAKISSDKKFLNAFATICFLKFYHTYEDVRVQVQQWVDGRHL